MGQTIEIKPNIFVPKDNERVLPFSANGHSGQFVWNDATGVYNMEAKTNGNGQLLPHWKLGSKVREHLTKQDPVEQLPMSGIIYQHINA